MGLLQTPATKYIAPTQPVLPFSDTRHPAVQFSSDPEDHAEFVHTPQLGDPVPQACPHAEASHKQSAPATCLSAPLTTKSEGPRFDSSLEQLPELRKNGVSSYQLIIKGATREQPKEREREVEVWGQSWGHRAAMCPDVVTSPEAP